MYRLTLLEVFGAILLIINSTQSYKKNTCVDPCTPSNHYPSCGWWEKVHLKYKIDYGHLRVRKGKVGSMSSNYGLKKKKKKKAAHHQARSDDLTSDLCTPLDCQRVRPLWQLLHPGLGIKHGSSMASTPAGLITHHNIICNSDIVFENVRKGPWNQRERWRGDQSC